MRLSEFGISSRQIQQALNQLRTNGPCKTHKSASNSSYITCPQEHDLWDLKPVVGIALLNSGYSVPPRDWQTPTFWNELLMLEFTLVRFDKLKGRNLGINGCDLEELNAPHTVFWPDGREVNNEFQPITTISDGPERRKTISNRFIRNSAFAQQVRHVAAGICDACGQQPFLTPIGNPYLEIHHKDWLSEGGPDIISNMVALCPNCHKQEHHGTQRKYRR